MSKYYDYSVKDTINGFFKENAILKMRLWDTDPETDDSAIIPLAWAYADQMAIGCFLADRFLEETVLFDDYIGYFVRRENKKLAYLCVMHFEEKLPFDLDPAYAAKLVDEWNSKGYETIIMRNCVCVDRYNDGRYRIASHLCANRGIDFLKPILIEGKYRFKSVSESFWDHATALFLDAVTKRSKTDFECLLSDDAELRRSGHRCEYDIANDKYENTELIADGIDSIEHYFGEKKGFMLAYIKGKKDAAFQVNVVSGNMKYVLFVRPWNRISQIVEVPIRNDEEVIEVPREQKPTRIPMPKIIGVRPLDTQQMHAYAIQITCDNGNVKNYYLCAFNQRAIPDVITFHGASFNEAVLASVKLSDETPGVVFSNGCFIPAHVLYYGSVSQMVPQKIQKTLCDRGGLRIEGRYRIPLKQGSWKRTYKPEPDEYYGVNETLIDDYGNRLTDYSGSYIDHGFWDKPRIIETRSEANGKLGYLKPDGSWLVPPIFDSAESFHEDQCVAVKIGTQQYLVNAMGEVIPFDNEIDTDEFCFGVCPFRAEKFTGKITYPEEEYFDELSPGLWGYVDNTGKIIIEPQYVFATRFGIMDCPRAFVARLIDGEPKWGLIDSTGNEIIKCTYPNLATHSGTAVNYQREIKGLYGIMDFDGNVIMKPRYGIIYEYNQEHGLIAAGEDWNRVGVSRMDTGKVIIPLLYQYVGFEETYIECEKDTGGLDYYDYDGNPLPAEIFERTRKSENGFVKWKERRCGLIDENGNTIIPFIYDESKYVDYYFEGFCVTGEKAQYGLTTKEGKRILEDRYSVITIEDEFIIAEKRKEGNFDYSAELYLKDGTKLFEDISRDIHIRDNTIVRDMPFGKEYYQIIR